MKEAQSNWERALEALRLARHGLELSADGTASRAYYAAFYASTALFRLTGATYYKHTAVEAAVHRDLVRTGRWTAELGARYSRLLQLRTKADYGEMQHVSHEDAREAIESAEAIIRAVARTRPDEFVLPENF